MTAEVPDWYRPALENADPEVALALGRHHLSRHLARQGGLPPEDRVPTSDLSFAQAWFRRAYEIDPATAWQAAEHHLKADYALGRQAAGWLRYAIEGEYPSHATEAIRVSPGCFPIFFDKKDGLLSTQGWGVKVLTKQVEAATAGLRAASVRLMLVDTNGVEHAGDEAPYERYGPDCVDVREHPEGPGLSMDHNDTFSAVVVRTMLRILVDELIAAGVTRAKLI